jgi:hypothetical protein
MYLQYAFKICNLSPKTTDISQYSMEILVQKSIFIFCSHLLQHVQKYLLVIRSVYLVKFVTLQTFLEKF